MTDPRATGEFIHSRYRIVSELGRGSSGLMYRAQDTVTGHWIALKELSLRGLGDWKKLELFEREARILQHLDHPAIPRYVDYFQVDTADNRLFYIAQEMAEGRSLAELVAAGERFSEREVKRIAIEILHILHYIHQLNPPLIHRDVKPQNLIRGDNGCISLVDFGAVQRVYRDQTALGSTVIGTYGYMAPEQFRGHASPATDLYGLGATLLHLLTHQNPSELPERRLKIDFRPYVTVSAEFAQWLETLLEPLVEDRFASAEGAIAALTQPPPMRGEVVGRDQLPSPGLSQKPPYSRIKFTRTQQSISVQIPPYRSWAVALGSTYCMVCPWGLGLLAIRAGIFTLGPLAAVTILLILGGTGLLALLGFVINLTGTEFLEIKPDHFTLTSRWLRLTTVRDEGPLKSLIGAQLSTVTKRSHAHQIAGSLKLLKPQSAETFGSFLTKAEAAWLAAEINAFIQEHRAR
ncbi:serine/threonine protein kinase [Nodosilinea sp. LEGE 07088]|uniref:serine/threonine protein kinase n=1 Tax=Nodosilinea sp. LEGE 07088 TaxID=2777968 RepID=UPI00187FC764|nr:serine/threonine-protein kinase [Nodosilinea sp. LEGE 07088]MBE9140659.1 serine/threonine protein kinase [Nodosilinea sp. LEGE 07088]